MGWVFQLILIAFIPLCHSQQVFMQAHNHPAAGPDLAATHLAQKIATEKSLFDDDDVRPEALVDPEGRLFIPEKKEAFKKAEDILREEEVAIAKVLEDHTFSISLSTWLWTLFGCSLVVSCGILPAFLLPAGSSDYFQTKEGKQKLNLLLSFAVGSLLGDVFLHLLPETWSSYEVDSSTIGLWTIIGLLVCFIVEKLCASTEESQHKICALMNLAANLIDNFTHGLAVGASFLISPKFGMMTTFAILVHEIPHEISDFAILLRADYNRVDAIKAQLITACGGVLGACAALWMRSGSLIGAEWILPFTAGGFINIALAQILPELNEETDTRQNLKQILFLLLGIIVMGLMNQLQAV